MKVESFKCIHHLELTGGQTTQCNIIKICTFSVNSDENFVFKLPKLALWLSPSIGETLGKVSYSEGQYLRYLLKQINQGSARPQWRVHGLQGPACPTAWVSVQNNLCSDIWDNSWDLVSMAKKWGGTSKNKTSWIGFFDYKVSLAPSFRILVSHFTVTSIFILFLKV